MKPIKVNLKFDKDGLGHDKAKDFTNHWWENAYNDAANNIDIEQSSSAGNDGVAITLKNGESIEVSAKFQLFCRSKNTEQKYFLTEFADFDKRYFDAKNANGSWYVRVRHDIPENAINAK